MSILNAVVTEGYTFTEAASGEIQLTKERLNRLAKPTVTVETTDLIATSDIKAANVTKAKLEDTVADKIFLVTATVGGTSPNKTATVQVTDVQGNAVSQACLIAVWLSTASGGAPTGSTLPTPSATTGTELVAVATSAVGWYLTDGTGKLVFNGNHSGGLDLYFNCAVGGNYAAGSGVMSWT